MVDLVISSSVSSISLYSITITRDPSQYRFIRVKSNYQMYENHEVYRAICSYLTLKRCHNSHGCPIRNVECYIFVYFHLKPESVILLLTLRFFDALHFFEALQFFQPNENKYLKSHYPFVVEHICSEA